MKPRPDLSCADLKPRIDDWTTAHVMPRDDGKTLIVCQNDAGECQEPFVCGSEGCVVEVLEKLVEIRPHVEIVRQGSEQARDTSQDHAPCTTSTPSSPTRQGSTQRSSAAA